MKNSKYCLIQMLLLFLLLSSCDRSAPDLSDIEEVQDSISSKPSFIYTKLSLNVNEIESALNKKFEKLIYEDKEFINREGTKMQIKIEKTEDIEIFEKGGLLNYKLPIKLTGRILINETVFGVKVRAEPKFSLVATLTLSSNIEIQDDLKTNIKTKIAEIIWPNKPIINTGPIRFDLTPAIESVIYSNESYISNALQKEVDKRLNLKDKFLSEMVKINKHHFLNAKNTNLWLEIEPLEFVIRRKPKIYNDSIVFNLGLEMLLNINTEQGNSDLVDFEKVPIKSLMDIPDQFVVNINMSIPYSQIDSIINKKVEQINSTDKLKGVQIGNTYMGLYHENQICILSEYSGKFQGKLFASGNLNYDSIEQVVELSNLDIYSYDNSLYTRLMLWFFGSNINAEIEERTVMPLNPFYEKLQVSIQESIELLKKKQNLELKLKEFDFKVTRIQPYKDRIEFDIEASGKSGLEYHLN